jgi:uracil-DNA glycosylase family 4
MMFSFNSERLSQSIHSCESCPRLREYCQKIAKIKRRAYLKETYWGKPIAGFGDPHARLVVVGLAPGAHGANRTGRMFTGDRSGEWLYRALHKSGFANQAHSSSMDDGLILRDTYITCTVKCAPPDNKPSREEEANCSEFLKTELNLLKEARVWIALGQIALKNLWPLLSPHNENSARPQFRHGGRIQFRPNQWLLLSYHPSQQNTFTGRLTEPMFDSIFSEAKKLLSL